MELPQYVYTRELVVNDKTRIIRKAGESLPVCDDSDITVFTGNENTGANDHPPISSNPGLIPARGPGANPDATLIKPAPNSGVVGSACTKPQAPDRIERAVPGSVAVTKTVIKGRFELDKLLGVGGMGAVYKALDRRKLEASDSDPYVAIKLLNEDFQKHPDAFISLQREARKSQTLAHPNIVTVFDFDRDGDRVFMTMEYLQGAPLDKVLRENSGTGLGMDRAGSILWDISQALIYAHSHRIVHSDFKPGNIFVTEKKGAKVIDFGIARAVSEGGVASKAGEKTVFDAGTLGALTPAYASLEMLKGGEPQPSDDVFALACVAYELYAGRHPFEKTPADKASERQLKPKRIRALSRRQWRALESALAFRRQDRTGTVEIFVDQFFGNSRWKWIFGGLFGALILVGAVGYSYQEQENVAEQKRVKVELEQKLQRELLERRISDKREAIDRLIGLSVLTPSWERDLKVEVGEYESLNPGDQAYPQEVRHKVSELFISAATGQLNLGNLAPAEDMLARAAKWNAENEGADKIRSQLADERAELRARLEQERLAAEREAERLRQEELRAQRRAAANEQQRQINQTLDQMESELSCSFGMRIADGVGASLVRLSQLAPEQAKKIRPVLASELVSCLSKLAVQSPARTESLLRAARVLLPAQQSLQAFDLDYCGHLQPGSGGRGDRYTCADRLGSGGEAPEMVVVNGGSGRLLAVSKYEVSNGDFRRYCEDSGNCVGLTLSEDSLPLNNITLNQANGYMGWLTDQTGRTYRLPTAREWFAAASANQTAEASDRNCHLKYGGIEKGVELVAAKSGTPNPFGVVNAVGNVREWVLDTDGRLLAAGGSRVDPMSRCLTTTKAFHNGGADELTGIRLVRDLGR